MPGFEQWLSFMAGFCVNYLHHFPFQVLHVIVWLFVARYLFKLRALRQRLEPEITRRDPITETEFRHRADELGKYDSHFDFFSSTFIFIGLIGTIYGFAGAVPRLEEEGYRFQDLASALSTSAFGIIWSVVLSIVLFVVHGRPAARLLDKLRARQVQDPLERSIPQLAGALAGPFRDSLDVFAKAAEGLTQAMNQFSASSTASAESFSKVAQQTAETAAKVDRVLENVTKLPESLAGRLDRVFEHAVQNLQAVLNRLDASVAGLAHLPQEMLRGMTEAFGAHLRQIEGVLQSYRESLAKLHGEWAQAVSEQAARLEQAVVRHEAAIGQLQDSLSEAVRGQVEHLERAFQLYQTSVHQIQLGAAQAVEQIKTQLEAAVSSAANLPVLIARRTVEATEAYLNSWRQQHQEALAELRRVGAEAANEQLAAVRQAIELFHEAVRKAEALPQAIAQSTLEATQACLARWKEDHEKALEELSRVATTVAGGQLVVIQQAAADLKQRGEEIEQKFREELNRQKSLVEEAVTASLTKVIEIVEGHRRGLEQVAESLPEGIRSAQQEVIRETVECAGAVRKLSTELVELAQGLPGILVQFRSDIDQLDHAARKVSEAASDFRQMKPLRVSEELERALRELVESQRQLRTNLDALTDRLAPKPVPSGLMRIRIRLGKLIRRANRGDV